MSCNRRTFSCALWLGEFADLFLQWFACLSQTDLTDTFLQYISTSHRFISCLLCSFILVRYSEWRDQKHLFKDKWFVSPDRQLNLGLQDSIVQWMHISVNELFIWGEFLVRLPSHQVDRTLYILCCALKTLVLYFCFPCRLKVWRLRVFFLLTVNE